MGISKKNVKKPKSSKKGLFRHLVSKFKGIGPLLNVNRYVDYENQDKKT